MDIGIFQVAANRDAVAVTVAKHAEDAGFESYWAPDHTIQSFILDVRIEHAPKPDCSICVSPPSQTHQPPSHVPWHVPDPCLAQHFVDFTRAFATTRVNTCMIKQATDAHSSSVARNGYPRDSNAVGPWRRRMPQCAGFELTSHARAPN